MTETASLKALAYKTLERLQRNTLRNNPETNAQNLVSRYISRETKNDPLKSPSQSHFYSSSLTEDYRERLAIAEYDGKQSSREAEWIAYLDAFISLLSSLAENDPHQDWLLQKIQTALEAQRFPTLN
ncbi:MAG: hypothetical protein ACD_16C00075G0002 [uncultured bacterium]|nr:MAG: hypothetical protein ACD_16C00075G0002 [uncultured bacterium]OFW85317.1 MAG: hypothetical protein A2W06_04480 [Alphaproteobacteria bacterium RBG_16_42_14]OGW10073.1 MAG: hypothetical protein A2W77_02695 [Nitrospinae bacterium RIFCSPLOWO2_12_39_16]